MVLLHNGSAAHPGHPLADRIQLTSASMLTTGKPDLQQDRLLLLLLLEPRCHLRQPGIARAEGPVAAQVLES